MILMMNYFHNSHLWELVYISDSHGGGEEGVMCSLKTKHSFVLLLWFVFSDDIYFILNFKLHLKSA